MHKKWHHVQILNSFLAIFEECTSLDLPSTELNLLFTKFRPKSVEIKIMDFKPTKYDDMESDDKYEQFFRFILTRKVPEEELENIQLRYIPNYMKKIKLNKVYWEKEYRKRHDNVSLKNWKSTAKQLQHEIRKHKIFLRNLDQMITKFVWNSDNGYFFTRSMDPERVKALISRIKENERDDNIILEMLKEDPVHLPLLDFTHTFYVVYASCALYGEFRIRPSRKGKIKMKEKIEEDGYMYDCNLGSC